jgi:hypothetical protein
MFFSIFSCADDNMRRFSETGSLMRGSECVGRHGTMIFSHLMSRPAAAAASPSRGGSGEVDTSQLTEGNLNHILDSYLDDDR